MTINDLVLSELATLVHTNERKIDSLTREGKDRELYLVLLTIRNASEYAMSRLKEIRPDAAPR